MALLSWGAASVLSTEDLDALEGLDGDMLVPPLWCKCEEQIVNYQFEKYVKEIMEFLFWL